MRNAFLVAFVLIVTTTLTVDHWTLHKNIEFQQQSEMYYGEALAGVNRASHEVTKAYGVVHELNVALLYRTNDLKTYQAYLEQITTVLRSQQEENVRLNGIIDDYSNKFAEKCEEFGELRVAYIKLYQYAKLASEYIDKANALLKANNLPLPEVEYDGERLFGEDQQEPTPATPSEDRGT